MYVSTVHSSAPGSGSNFVLVQDHVHVIVPLCAIRSSHRRERETVGRGRDRDDVAWPHRNIGETKEDHGK